MEQHASSTATTVRGHVGSRPPVGAGATQVTLRTPADVLYANELMRGRLWVAICAALSVGGLFMAAAVDAPGRVARLALAVGCGVLLIISVVALRILRDDAHYSTERAAFYSYASLATILPAYHFFGWFSVVVLLVALGGVIFAMGHTLRTVLVLLGAIVTSHATFAGLTIGGVLPDRGIAMLRVEGIHSQLLCIGTCEVMFALAFFVGRRLRTQVLQGVESYGAAIRESARREVLLQEAHDELKRARVAGEPGRYTGLEIGSYRLGVVLGRGAMGEVYDAAHTESGAPAAVKVMALGADVDERAVRRFAREIELARAIVSPHVVRVLEYSAVPSHVMYLAMERLEGSVLAEELRALHRLADARIIAMLRQVAEGVTAAHRVGVVHRDLSPRNLFHHRGGGADVWKVLDFGVSKLQGSNHSLTGDAIVGTPGYMSPEQASGRDLDHRSDLFALGCIAYRCLTGRPPFRGNTIADIVYRVVHEMPQRPSSVADLPPELDVVFTIALAKDREQRFATAADLVAALAQACQGQLDPTLRQRGEALARVQPWKGA